MIRKERTSSCRRTSVCWTRATGFYFANLRYHFSRLHTPSADIHCIINGKSDVIQDAWNSRRHHLRTRQRRCAGRGFQLRQADVQSPSAVQAWPAGFYSGFQLLNASSANMFKPYPAPIANKRVLSTSSSANTGLPQASTFTQLLDSSFKCMSN